MSFSRTYRASAEFEQVLVASGDSSITESTTVADNGNGETVTIGQSVSYYSQPAKEGTLTHS